MGFRQIKCIQRANPWRDLIPDNHCISVVIVLLGLLLGVETVFAEQNQVNACDPELMTCPDTSPLNQTGVPYFDAPPLGAGDQARIFTLLDTSTAVIGTGIRDFVRGVDAFFADEKLTYENSGSYVRLTVDSAWFARDSSGFFAGIRARLRLPRSSEKYKLIIENSPEQSRNDLDPQIEDTLVAAADKQDYFAGIQAVGGSEKRWRYRSGIGFKLGSPVESYLRWGSWREFLFEDSTVRLEATIYRYSDFGMRYLTAVEYSHHLPPDLLFRSRTQADWSEVNRYYDTQQVFSLYKALSAKRQLVLQAGAYAVTEPVFQVTDYRLSLSLRHSLRKKYLFVELIPQIRYQNIHDFQPERGVILRLEWVFQA
jgi:hypothetical protein